MRLTLPRDIVTRPAARRTDLSLRRILGGLTLAVACVAITGCTAPGGNDADEDAPAVTAEPGLNIRAGIPPQAEQVAESRNSIEYIASQPGTVYVYDRNANQVVSQFHMEESQRLLVSGEAGRVTLGGNEMVVMNPLRRNRVYTVYLLPTGSNQDRDARSGQGFRIVPDNGDEN